MAVFGQTTSRLDDRTFWVLWWAGFLSWCGGLALAAPWDLSLSQRVVERSALFGLLVERFGELPGWLAIVISLVVLIRGKANRPRLQAFRPLAWTIIVLALVSPLTVTHLLKYFWGRVRFYKLLEDFSAYTPFYIPAGVGVGDSFPSGHTAMGFVLSPIAFFATRAKGLIGAMWSWPLVLTIGVGVGWGRILRGAHFLTDCLFSAGLALLLSALLIRWLLPENGVSKLIGPCGT
jgi:membrane-associated PAP2 superfamily phosphatase